MAIEARRLSFFPQEVLSDRGMMMINGIDGAGSVYGTETLIPICGPVVTEGFPGKPAPLESGSGLSYAVLASRKRSRDLINPMAVSLLNGVASNQSVNNCCASLTFLGEDFSFQFQQQQEEIDRFITQQTEKVLLEVEEQRKRYTRRIGAAAEEHITKRLKAKEDEIQKMSKLNWALAEKLKSLCVENQIWRDLAQTNEATVNALRCNLEQVLAQVQDEQPRDTVAAVPTDDAQSSCCGSNSDDTPGSALANIRDAAEDRWGAGGRGNSRMCRRCQKEESSVVLLPCRHLCLCAICGSSTQKCPVCYSTQSATVHINLSPS